MTMPAFALETELADRISGWMEELHDELTAFFTRLDGGTRFREDPWVRPGGGGGITRVLSEGRVFEKAGVNRSTVYGELPEEVAHRLGGRVLPGAKCHFFATGVSVVVHPRSPRIPTVHLNVRYFELDGPRGEPLDAWFGGGADLSPTYPCPDDAVLFHRALRDLCGRHHPGFYPRFKSWCDEYFVNAHREGEMRGVGGVFYDYLRPGEAEGLDEEALFAFTRDVGRCAETAYAPIVERRGDEPYSDPDRHLQLLRRGRYVEFNLIHDRGTLFGLQTHGRTESILMSLPPHVCWEYSPRLEPGSDAERLQAMLRPRDWAAGAEGAAEAAG